MIGETHHSADFNEKVEYVLDKEKGQFLFTQNLLNTEDPGLIAASMRACASQADARCKKPVYHLILSWDPQDEVTREQMAEVGKRVLKELGLEEYQAVAGEHSDKPHPHVHIVVNRVHPEDGVWNLKGDWKVIEQGLRKIEVEFGWRQVEGNLSIQPGHELPPRGPGEIRVEYEERKAQGLPPLQRGRDRAHSEVVARRKKKPMPEELPRTRKELYGMWFSASRGDVDAQWKMGRMYMLGAGVRMDMEIAAGWFVKASEQGHAQAKKEFDRLEARGVHWVFPPGTPMAPSRKEEGISVWGMHRGGFSRDIITDRISDRIDNSR